MQNRMERCSRAPHGCAPQAVIRDGRLEAMASPMQARIHLERIWKSNEPCVECGVPHERADEIGAKTSVVQKEQKLREVRPVGRTLLKVNMNASSESWQRLHCRSACATALLMIASTDTSSHSDCFWNAFTSSVSFLRAAAAACTYYVP